MSQNDATWTARISPEIKEYLQIKKGLSGGHCLREYYKILRSNELDEAHKELDRREKAVLQQRAFVTQLQSQCNTEWGICNTVFKQLALQPSFDINNLDKSDKYRIESLLEKKEIKNITVDQFITHYQELSHG